MEEGGHEPFFIVSFFFFITSRLFPKSSAKVERNEKKNVVFTNSKSLRHSLNGHPRMQTGMRVKKLILYQENTRTKQD